MVNQSKCHAVMIAFPYQGHVIPFTKLALKLASKGFTVTFVHLEFIHAKLCKAHAQNDIFAEALKSGLDVRYATIDDGFPLEFDRELRAVEYWEVMVRDFPARVDEFVGRLMDQRADAGPRPTFLVTDVYFTWSAKIAAKYNLVNVAFSTHPALVFALLYHWDLLAENGHFPCPDDASDINYIPGVRSMHAKDLVSFLKKTEPPLNEAMYKMLFSAFQEVKNADFVLHNTVDALEFETLSALNACQPNYAIGPINFFGTKVVSKSLRLETDCTQWLEPKPPGSVFYVSFGSTAHASKRMIEEIAHGLALSGVDFIWVVREGILGSHDGSVLPLGFKDEVKDRGLIVSWCDQVKLLSSPAIGVFLTHGGWNSIVESIWYGVPMMCCPICWDQITNRKLVVDDWKIGMNVCDGELIERGEIARKINSFMDSSVSMGLRAEVDGMKGAMWKALEVEGSSEINFNKFVRDLEAMILNKATNSSDK